MKTRRFKILLIEDDDMLRTLVESNVRHAGYFIESVENGLKGIDAILKGDYSLILCDVQMPGMNGMEVFDELNRKGKVPPISFVFLTGAATIDQDFINRSGILGYLKKPVKRAELIKMIKHVDVNHAKSE